FGYQATTSGWSAASRRVNTSTSMPRSAKHRLKCATYTFCPPASALPSAASGDAWSLIIAILCMGRPPPCCCAVVRTEPLRCNDLLERIVPVVHEALDREAAASLPSCACTEPRGLVRIREEPLHVLDEPIDTRIRETRDAVLDDGRHFRRRERDDRQANGHRFAHGEAETRVADRVEEESISREQHRQVRMRNLADSADRL